MIYIDNSYSTIDTTELQLGERVYVINEQTVYKYVREIKEYSKNVPFIDLIVSGNFDTDRSEVPLCYSKIDNNMPDERDTETFPDGATYFIPKNNQTLVKQYGKWISNNSGTSNIIYSQEDPKINSNPLKIGQIWTNIKTGQIWVCIDNTEDANVWINQKDQYIRPLPDIEKFDVFGDGSALSFVPFQDGPIDLSGIYKLSEHGAIQYDNTLLGHSAKFDGKSYVLYENLTPINSDSITTTLWFKCDGRPTRDRCLFHCSYSGTNTFSIWVRRNQLFVIINDTTITSSKVYKPDEIVQPFFVALTSNGNYYINGVLDRKTKRSVNPRHFKMQTIIGADRDGRSINDWFVGHISNVRIFNRVLTDQEIKDLYEAGLEMVS